MHLQRLSEEVSSCIRCWQQDQYFYFLEVTQEASLQKAWVGLLLLSEADAALSELSQQLLEQLMLPLSIASAAAVRTADTQEPGLFLEVSISGEESNSSYADALKIVFQFLAGKWCELHA